MAVELGHRLLGRAPRFSVAAAEWQDRVIQTRAYLGAADVGAGRLLDTVAANSTRPMSLVRMTAEH